MTNSKKDPLFHLVKRDEMSKKLSILIRFIGISIGFVFAILLMLLLFGVSPFAFFKELFAGAFGSQRNFYVLLRTTALLLCVGLALIPAFKMKFWNLGGNGQILIAALVTAMCMVYMGRAGVADAVIILVMIPASIAAAIIWAVIPAIFKAFFNTNESLFTLMMNYVATCLVSVWLSTNVSGGSGVLGMVNTGALPELGNKYFLTILVAIILLIFVNFYLKYSKHGYELSVVGESVNTARYVGINTKATIIRTMILSGAICGIVGLLLTGSINHSVSETSANNMGFTAIMVAWLANFNPFIMLLTAFFITFLSRGMTKVQSAFGITSDATTYILTGVIYFFIIGTEFFIRYKVCFRQHKKTKLNIKGEK